MSSINSSALKKEDETRIFSMFKDEGGVEQTVATKNIGQLDELKHAVYGDEKDPFPRVNRLIDAFAASKIPGKLSGRAAERRPHLLIAGGFVRDVLTGAKPKDIDFVSNATYEEMRGLLVNSFKEEIREGKLHFDETGKDFGVMRFTFAPEENSPREEYEIASFRSDTEEGDGRRPAEVMQEKRPGVDVMRRDITANALLYNPKTGTVIDYVGGLKDIADKKLRFVGDPHRRIAEDKLRALRYVRFLFKTGFEEDPSAKAAIQATAPEVARVLPGERVAQELNAMLQYHPYGKVVETLEHFGLLKEILPEISRLKDCPQGAPYHMEGDVFVHTLAVINNLPSHSPLELVWASIIHDVEKPSTRTVEPDVRFGERVRFHGHEESGAKSVREILRRLRYSDAFVESVEWLVANHLRIFSFCELSEAKAQKMAAHPHFVHLMDLGLADARASKPHPAVEDTAYGGEQAHELFAKIRAHYEEITRFKEAHIAVLDEVKKAINGFEIIKKFKEIHGSELKGKQVGILKNLVEEAVGDARITNPEEARAVLERIVGEHSS